MSRLGAETPSWLFIISSSRVCLTTTDWDWIMLKTLSVMVSLASPETVRPALGKEEKVQPDSVN